MTHDRTPTQGLDESSPNRFRLFRYFLLMSVAAFVAIVSLSGLGLHEILMNYVIREAERDAVGLTTALRDGEVSKFVRTGPTGQPELLIRPEEIPELDRAMRTFLDPFSILKIKIFNRGTRIIYSTDAKIIGEVNHGNAKLESALSGVAISKLEDKDSVWDLADEERINIDLVETYTPVRTAEGRVIGSFEIYKDVTSHLREAHRTLNLSLGVLGVVLLSVFAALSGLMRRAARTIHSHTAALEESRRRLRQFNEELEDKVTERTAELARTVQNLEVAKERAEAASRAKTEFLANVGHEFRTPLNSIMGYSETMGRLVERGKYDSLSECTVTVQKAANHLSLLIDDVMDISAIEADRVELCLEDVSAASVCEQVKAHCAADAESKGLTFETEVSEQLPLVHADSTRLTQVLTNLVSNAIKFTDHGGVSVTARATGDGGSVEFLVTDTGPGIGETDQERVFERFERLDTSGSKRGSGLGLAISRKLVESHGGTIWVDSTPGRGSVFHFTIPVGASSAVGVVQGAY